MLRPDLVVSLLHPGEKSSTVRMQNRDQVLLRRSPDLELPRAWANLIKAVASWVWNLQCPLSRCKFNPSLLHRAEKVQESQFVTIGLDYQWMWHWFIKGWSPQAVLSTQNDTSKGALREPNEDKLVTMDLIQAGANQCKAGFGFPK